MQSLMNQGFLRAQFDAGLAYEAYLDAAKTTERENWRAFHARVHLTAAQMALLGSFTRRIHALCISGSWCGDCVQQCPMLDHIARASPKSIELRFVDRDAHADLSGLVRLCGGARVPVVLLMNEDFDLCALAGDRTLSRYRALASRMLGPACPLPGAPVPADEIAATLADWVSEFERVHLMLRLSAKLRQRYAD